MAELVAVIAFATKGFTLDIRMRGNAFGASPFPFIVALAAFTLAFSRLAFAFAITTFASSFTLSLAFATLAFAVFTGVRAARLLGAYRARMGFGGFVLNALPVVALLVLTENVGHEYLAFRRAFIVCPCFALAPFACAIFVRREGGQAFILLALNCLGIP